MMKQIVACRRVRLNRGGYAYGGWQYFGTGIPLYYVEFRDGRSGHVRAWSREQAMTTAVARPGYWGIR